MKSFLKFTVFVLLTGMVIFISCKKNDEIIPNIPPVAHAGTDQVIILPADSAILDGTGSKDPDGSIVRFLWTKMSGPAPFTISNAAAARTVVKNLSVGTYQFDLKITDNGSLYAEDMVQIIVFDPLHPNRPPVAHAGADQTIALPANTVTVDGSGCSDPEMNIMSYSWTKISGPVAFNIVNANHMHAQVNNLAQGIYQFELKVTDAGGLFSRDTVTITVNSNLRFWTQLQYLPADEFFFGEYLNWWFNGFNFLMGIDDKVFAVGHYGGVWQYNTQINSWSRIGTFPEQMPNLPVVFVVNEKGYCIGNGHCWQYDPATNQWLRKTDPPDYIHDPLVINNKVYLRGTNNQLLVYDPSSNSYTQKNNLPDLGSSLLGQFVVNGNGYYIGGTGQTWKYDPGSDSWQQKASFSVQGSVYSTSSFSLNNYGYIIGDLNFTAYNDSKPMKVWRYDPSLDQWHQFEEDYPGYGAYYINTVSLNGIAYVGLGYNNGDFNAIDFWSFKE